MKDLKCRLKLAFYFTKNMQNKNVKFENLIINQGDAIDFYQLWKHPKVIISDGPYGIKGFPGDMSKPEDLAVWYKPHIKEWSDKAEFDTTLWFWNTEIGWANVHPILKKYGWEYKACNIWNKGKAHIAGNVNTKSIKNFPVVTEVCVQYYKKPQIMVGKEHFSLKEWLRYEWKRSSLPLKKTNDACGVKDAATRKYFTQCDLWYFPPVEKMELLVNYANRYGKESGKPYFSLDGKEPVSAKEWGKMRPLFQCPHGHTNVWDEPPLNGKERLKNGTKALHLNQKPLKITELIIESSSKKGDIVWEPFGGLFTGVIAAKKLGRIGYGAEITSSVFNLGAKRIGSIFNSKDP